MPANLLALPLLAGYLFVHISTRFRFRAQALDGYRLLIESAIAGAFLLFLARVITWLLAGTQASAVWHDLAPDVPYLGTAALTLILGLLLPAADNIRPRTDIRGKLSTLLLKPRIMSFPRRLFLAVRSAYRENRFRGLDAEIRVNGNALIRLLHKAAFEQETISITLTNRKWYVGYLAELVSLNPKETHLSLLPIMSVYRDKDSLSTVRTIYYRDVYSQYTEPDLSVFHVLIKMTDIVEARIFDEEVYEDHFATGRGEEDQETTMVRSDIT